MGNSLIINDACLFGTDKLMLDVAVKITSIAYAMPATSILLKGTYLSHFKLN